MKGKYSYLLQHTNHKEIIELSKLTRRPITTPQQVCNILAERSKHIELLDLIHQKVNERITFYETLKKS